MKGNLLSKKTILGIVVAVFLLLVGAYYGAGFYIYNQVTAIEPRCERVYMEGKRDNTPSHFYSRFTVNDELVELPRYFMPAYEEVNFISRSDGLNLSAWFIPAAQESDEVVIIVHGIHGCKQDSTVLIPAGMLHHGGFNVLLIDLRNHGASEIQDGRTSAGNREYNDVLGAFDYLQERGFEPENIGLVGISFGAGTAAIAFGEEPNIPALWLDSPFGNIAEIVDHELQRNKFPTIFRTAAIQIAQINGVPLQVLSPDEEIQKHLDRPIMIVHGTEDERVPFRFGEQLYANAGPNAQFMPFEGMLHVEAMYELTDVYETTLIGFFTENLMDGD